MDRKLTINDIITIKSVTGLEYDEDDNSFFKSIGSQYTERLRFYDYKFLYWTEHKTGDYAMNISFEWIRKFYAMGLFDE